MSIDRKPRTKQRWPDIIKDSQEVARYFKNLSIPLSFEDRFGDL
jgi:hypothetical protein